MAHGFTGPEEGAVLALLDATTGQELWRASERGVQILGLAFSRDGLTIASGCGHFNDYTTAGYARLRAARTGTALGRPIAGGPGGVLSVGFSPTAAGWPWPVGTSSTSATSPTRAGQSCTSFAGMSTSSMPPP